MRWAGQRGFADRVHRAKATWPGPGKVHLRFAAVRYRVPGTAGSERPAAVARARQLQGKPNIIAAVLEQALIEEILARLNCGSVRRSRHGLSAAPFSKRGARRRAW
jgi:hypothetical protein